MTDPVTLSGPDEMLIDGERWIRGTRHDARCAELLAANNAEVERRRDAENKLAELQAIAVRDQRNAVSPITRHSCDAELRGAVFDEKWSQVWALIYGDRKQRFTDGENVTTSRVMGTELTPHGLLVVTKNSRYLVTSGPMLDDAQRAATKGGAS